MTTKEMIELLTRHAITDRVFGGTRYDTIIAALKAGELMRDSAQMTSPSMDGKHLYRPVSQEAFSTGVRAWDEATEEGV